MKEISVVIEALTESYKKFKKAADRGLFSVEERDKAEKRYYELIDVITDAEWVIKDFSNWSRL